MGRWDPGAGPKCKKWAKSGSNTRSIRQVILQFGFFALGATNALSRRCLIPINNPAGGMFLAHRMPNTPRV